MAKKNESNGNSKGNGKEKGTGTITARCDHPGCKWERPGYDTEANAKKAEAVHKRWCSHNPNGPSMTGRKLANARRRKAKGGRGPAKFGGQGRRGRPSKNQSEGNFCGNCGNDTSAQVHHNFCSGCGEQLSTT